MSEELTTFLKDKGLKVAYLHSEIETLDRTDILEDMRRGIYDVVVGVNLLREGLDLPEVSLVIILDADKEGFLRSRTSMIQTMGRAARHVQGKVIMYADRITDSMRAAIDEVQRRREIQIKYNQEHGITPQAINKKIKQKLIEREKAEVEEACDKRIQKTFADAVKGDILPQDKNKLVNFLTKKMKEAAKEFRFEEAAVLRDKIIELQK
jgi:excinuclease ABC subunit B